MINYLIYNNVTTRKYKCVIEGAQTFKTPARNYEIINVPGKNGYLLKDNGTYNPVIISYRAFIVHNMMNNYRTLTNLLSKDCGVHRLEDTFDPLHFRLATFNGELSPDVFALRAANFQLDFTAQPQRFLKSGEIAKTFTKSGELFNPTDFESEPLIKITGTGQVGINENVITINQAGTNYIEIDSAQKDALEETSAGIVYRNKNITLLNHIWPTLKPGKNTIVLSGGVGKVEIIPRYWEL